MFKSMLYYIT